MNMRLKTTCLPIISFCFLATSCFLRESDDLRWFKGNTHTHTLWSDGDDLPESVADWYKRHGYHFLVLSDHNILSRGEKWKTLRADQALPVLAKAEKLGERACKDAIAGWEEASQTHGARRSPRAPGRTWQVHHD